MEKKIREIERTRNGPYAELIEEVINSNDLEKIRELALAALVKLSLELE